MWAHFMLRPAETVDSVDIGLESYQFLVLIIPINIKVNVHLFLLELLWICYSVCRTDLAASLFFGKQLIQTALVLLEQIVRQLEGWFLAGAVSKDPYGTPEWSQGVELIGAVTTS